MPPRTTQQTQGYPDLSSVDNPSVQRILRLAFDRINSLQGRPGDNPTFSQSTDHSGNQAKNLADPSDNQDAVTLAYAQAHFGGAATRASLMAGGPTPLPVIGLPGNNQSILVDVRANLPAAPLLGQAFFAVDLNSLYISNLTGGWQMVVGYGVGTVRPTLDVIDANYIFYAQDQAVIYLWSGAVWHYECGTLSDSLANRPAAGGANISGGFRFAATDLGMQEWEYDLTNLRWQFAGGGIPIQGTLPISGALTAGLTAQDAGLLYRSTDFDRLYLWNGGGWQDAPGQPIRRQIGWFDTTNPGTAWHICDGSGDTISTPSGSTAGYTRPNLVTGSNRFVRSSTVPLGTGGIAAQTTVVDPPSTTSSGPSATVTVDNTGAGSTVQVATSGHTHTTDIAPTTTSAWDNQPPYLDLVPYIRL